MLEEHMSTPCPICKGILHLSVKTDHIFTVKEVGLNDVIPEEKVDEKKRAILFCDKCKFRGWLDDYHEAASGIIRLFRPGERDVPKEDN
jgi:hypothetical protein